MQVRAAVMPSRSGPFTERNTSGGRPTAEILEATGDQVNEAEAASTDGLVIKPVLVF